MFVSYVWRAIKRTFLDLFCIVSYLDELHLHGVRIPIGKGIEAVQVMNELEAEQDFEKRFRLPPAIDIAGDWNSPLPNLTVNEIAVMDYLASAHNRFLELTAKLPEDDAMFAQAINHASSLIALRVARRIEPHRWTQPKKPEPKGIEA